MKGGKTKLVIEVSLNVLLIVLSAFVILWISGRVYTFGYNIFNEQSVDTEENARVTEVTIPENVSASKLASIMYDKGLTKDEFMFYLQVELSNYKGKFKAGDYTLNTSMKPTDIMKMLVAGPPVEEETK